MLLILFFTLILYVVISSAGLFFCQLYKIKPFNPFTYFFIGCFTLGFLAILTSMFFPLGKIQSLCCLSISIFGFPALFRNCCTTYTSLTKLNFLKVFFIASLISISICLVLAYKTWPNMGDTDLYHMQIIRWINEYGMVPGLANIHSRFGTTYLWLILAALFNHGPIHGSIPWVMPTLFAVSIFTYFLYYIKSHHKYISIFSICFLPACYCYILRFGFPNLYCDAQSLIFVGIIACEFLYFIYNENINYIKQATIVCLLITTAFLIKSIPIVTVILLPIFIIYSLYSRNILNSKSFYYIFAGPFLAAALWVASNIILTGYPFFPTKLFACNVDWLLPASAADGLTNAVRGWARWPKSGYQEALAKGITYWFYPWAKSFLSNKINVLFFLLPICSGAVFWIITLRHKINKIDFVLFLWPALSLVYWFWLAPDTRFGLEYAWLFFALSIVCLEGLHIVNFSLLHKWAKKNAIVFACVLLLLYPAIKRIKTGNVFWVEIGTVPARETIEKDIPNEDISVKVPVNGDQCGYAELPCTPYFNDNFQLRKHNDLSHGFKRKTSGQE